MKILQMIFLGKIRNKFHQLFSYYYMQIAVQFILKPVSTFIIFIR